MMNSTKKISIDFTGFCFFVFLFLLLVNVKSMSAQNIPVLSFDDFQKKLHPKDDTIYVINFWATWCKPCVEELPNFEKLTETYKNQKVKVLLVSLDFKSQYEKKVVPFVAKNQLKSEVIVLDAPDYNSWLDKVSPEWSGSIPATTVIQGTTNTRKFYEKQFTYSELENIIKPLLNL